MALKIVQLIGSVTPPNSGIATSGVINLKSGYLRLTSRNGGCHINILDGINTAGTASSSTSFLIPTNTSEVLKERISRQTISGITTGSSTVVSFSENSGNPFVVGDKVSIIGSQNSGINTSFATITSLTDSSITLNFNSTSVGGALTVTSAIVSRCVKVEVFPENNGSQLHIAEVQITSQA